MIVTVDADLASTIMSLSTGRRLLAESNMAEWIQPSERRPLDGEIVQAWWLASELGEAFWDVVRYRYRKQRQEANSHLWHRPDDERDDYTEPDFWQAKPDAPVPKSTRIIDQTTTAHTPPPWISVQERYPEIDQDVIYYFDVCGTYIGKYLGEHCFAGDAGFLTDDVTNWMPYKRPKRGAVETPAGCCKHGHSDQGCRECFPLKASAHQAPADEYLILCRAHTHGYALWWRPKSAGYTNHLEWAGRYSREEAESIVRNSDRGEEMWPVALIMSQAKPRHMVDMGDSAHGFFEEKRNRDWLQRSAVNPSGT